MDRLLRLLLNNINDLVAYASLINVNRYNIYNIFPAIFAQYLQILFTKIQIIASYRVQHPIVTNLIVINHLSSRLTYGTQLEVNKTKYTKCSILQT